MRPILKWVGGKRRQAEAIDHYLGPGRVYWEPFAGSLAVYCYRCTTRGAGPAVLTDANGHLISTYIAIRDHVDLVIEYLGRMETGPTWREWYAEMRAAHNAEPVPSTEDARGCAEHAARFIWLNRAGYNGLYRENRAGKYNVPPGDHRTVTVPHASHLRRFADALRDATLGAGGFASAMSRAGRGDVIYCDPPYLDGQDGETFTGYASGGFGVDDHHRLAVAAIDAADRGARVVLSNHDTDQARAVYSRGDGFRVVETLRARRSVGGRGASRQPAPEIIMTIGE